MYIPQPKITPPPKLLPVGYQPVGSVPYKVKDGDSWTSLAKIHKVDPLWLIQYNFETRDPAVINWYLKNRVGCTLTTAGNKNYRFSSKDKPGIISVPLPEAVSGLVSLAYKAYNIEIKGDNDYKLSVETTLSWIARSETGMVLLRAIQGTGKTITISEFEEGTKCNATAAAVNVLDATPTGEIVLKGGNSFEQLKEPNLLREMLELPLEPYVGTGKGSEVIVQFTPNMWGFGNKSACMAYAGLPGASPSQVLFHELVHAYRTANGKLHPRPTIGASANYDNMEEFFAIVLTNVLTADPTYSTGNRALRASHAGFILLAPQFSTSHGFAADIANKSKLRELALSEPRLIGSLKTIKSRFNPFVEI